MKPDRIDKALTLIEAVYNQPKGGVGGGLHIVLDDGNVEDHHIRWCMNERPGGLTEIERQCAEHLLTMTEDERSIALAFWDNLP